VSNDLTKDYEALRALGQRYARAADERDVDALAALFHPEAVVDGARGVLGIADWLDTMRGPSPHPVSMHNLGDPLIELSGDTAHLDTYAVVYMVGDKDAGPPDMTLGMRYVDDAVRHGDGWVIRHRVARSLWMR
jgi:ketosteroid isomerase-like protein